MHKVRYSGGKFGVIILPLLYENAYVELINSLYLLHRRNVQPYSSKSENIICLPTTVRLSLEVRVCDALKSTLHR